MQFEAARLEQHFTISLFRSSRRLTSQMSAEDNAAEMLQKLNGPEAQYHLKQLFSRFWLDLGIEIPMPGRLEVREMPANKRIGFNKFVVDGLSEKRLDRSHLLSRKRIAIEKRKSRSAEQIVHAEMFTKTFELRPNDSNEVKGP